MDDLLGHKIVTGTSGSQVEPESYLSPYQKFVYSELTKIKSVIPGLQLEKLYCMAVAVIKQDWNSERFVMASVVLRDLMDLWLKGHGVRLDKRDWRRRVKDFLAGCTLNIMYANKQGIPYSHCIDKENCALHRNLIPFLCFFHEPQNKFKEEKKQVMEDFLKSINQTDEDIGEIIDAWFFVDKYFVGVLHHEHTEEKEFNANLNSLERILGIRFTTFDQFRSIREVVEEAEKHA